MINSNIRHITLVTPSLTSGGAERVISELANYFSESTELKISVICLIKGKKFYRLCEKVRFAEPEFDYKKFSRLSFTWKIIFFLRMQLRFHRPDVLLTFGGKYNSFVLLAASGLGIRCFVSDRSRPTISYGKFLDFLNRLMYKKAYGIVAQTAIAERIIRQKIQHDHVKTIGNPIALHDNVSRVKENVILNVGRFIPSKHQVLLIEYFAEIRTGNWKLIFLGEGRLLNEAKFKAKDLGVDQYVEFPGVVKNIAEYYNKAKIFAFTSTSEGFPNVLGEAMAIPVACISFDCVAGPADLIKDGVNGYLVPEMDHENYKQKLKRLMEDEILRSTFEAEAKKSMTAYSIDRIGMEYFNFLVTDRK